MAESPSSIDLASLFEAATRAVADHQREINELDGYNGNHGDNMVRNVQAITETLRAHRQDPPSDALKLAGQQLQEHGAGGTSRFYAQGLQQAAERLSGKSRIDASDGMTLIETLLGAIPAEGYPQPQEAAPTVLDLLTGLSGSATAPAPQPTQPETSQAGGLLGALLGLSGTQVQSPPSQPSPAPQATDPLAGLLGMLTGADQPQQAPSTAPAESGVDMGDLVGKLLPAGLAYLQARQAGADGGQAAQAALAHALMGGQATQAQTPRQAAGTIIAQSMLKALLNR